MEELLYRAVFSQFLGPFWGKALKHVHKLVFGSGVRGGLNPYDAAALFGFELTQPAWTGDLAGSLVFHTWTNTHNNNMRRLYVFKWLKVDYICATGQLSAQIRYSVHAPSGNEVGNA